MKIIKEKYRIGDWETTYLDESRLLFNSFINFMDNKDISKINFINFMETEIHSQFGDYDDIDNIFEYFIELGFLIKI